MRSFSNKVIFSFFSIFAVLAMLVPQLGSAHPLSAGFTTLQIGDKQTDLIYSIDSLSIIEGFESDKNENESLEDAELKAVERRVEEWVEDGLLLEKDGRQQSGELKSMKLEQKGDKQVVTFHFIFPKYSAGQTITLIDGILYKKENSAGYTNFLTAEYAGQASEAALQGKNRTWTILLTENQQQQGAVAPQEPSSGWMSFFTLGMEHIITGYDHLLFLLALLIRKQTLKQYIMTLTAFTIAHSITLSLAVLNIVHLPSRLVESVIALSICYVALENIFRKEVSQRWIVTFLFGLVHGFGFAGILQEMSISKSHLAVALLNFNLGIEAVQLALVLLFLWPLYQLHRLKQYKRVVMGISACTLVLGAVWLAERLLS
ncbi:HupE/UreJ family protein [Ectobacillus ponti]|uniref:HupE/UreJ family protein n=1 Tax=Ectobacillus ponti TaxID=2961894 RepID=A0AA41X7E1_9BACI|nr:HupE/UreJ family protein [Ectobacillus ponti]MCP8967658.1 HupE/UreJ family protein [Ectobacillus ponti]